MAYRNVMIESPAHLSIRNGQLIVRTDAVEKHRQRLRSHLPDNGSVRLLVITEKQFSNIEIMLGRLTQADEPFQCEQMSIF